MKTEETFKRRCLPHWYVPEAAIFVTFRVAGTFPAHVARQLAEKLEADLKGQDDTGKRKAHKKYFAGFDKELDRSAANTWLHEPPVAAMVRRALRFHNGSLYALKSYCIMPNHVHVLLIPKETDSLGEHASPLARAMHAIKSYTSKEANKILGRQGRFWQDESYDHWVRDDEELEGIIDYIADNPVKAGLVLHPWRWPFCSAHDRFVEEGTYDTWLEDLP
ncbi:MAG: transposase [Gemmataceae bacterium]|nr:transposase [Gemmataceae bacterium]